MDREAPRCLAVLIATECGFRLLCQVLATVATLGWVPGNAAKLVTMLVIWGLGFGAIRAAELVAMTAVDLIFVLMNQAALRQGIFPFDYPDFLGMPANEFLSSTDANDDRLNQVVRPHLYPTVTECPTMALKFLRMLL